MNMNTAQRREFIVYTAVELAHEKGFHYVSTKEIARRLKISEALIYKIFPRKNDILIAVLDQFSSYDSEIFRSAIESYGYTLEGIFYAIHRIIAYYETYPAITAVYQAYGSLKSEPELENKVNSIFFRRVEALKRMIEIAWETGRVREEWKPEAVADILTSIITGMCLQWRMRDFSFSLMDRTLNEVKLILNTVKDGDADVGEKAFTCTGKIVGWGKRSS